MRSLMILIISSSLWAIIAAQTFSSCNPLTAGGCPPNPALGKSLSVDLTKGAPSDFEGRGNPTYDGNGASLTVAKSGDSPQLTSKFYIMFGKLEVTIKAASGAGIVSSVVLQSDALDEIDWEWLGANPGEVQTNFFGKGQTTTYNRGAWHPNPNSQSSFKTYTIDWTADQIVWQIDGTTIRALQPQQAQGQYPQTPMQVKIGAWSGGDTALNEQGTVEWARGPTDYSKGPFTMQVKSILVTDYSTGTQYRYTGSAGTWQSIEAVGGKVNTGASGVMENAPVVTTAPGMPAPFQGTHRSSGASFGPNGWVSTPTTMATSTFAASAYPGLPSGWTVTSSGKSIDQLQSSSPPFLVSSTSPLQATPGGVELRTSFDDRGFPTLVPVAIAGAGAGVPASGSGGAANATPPPRRYDDRGFVIPGGGVVEPTPTSGGSGAAPGSPGAALRATAKAEAAAGFHTPIQEGDWIGGLLMALLGGMLLL